MMDSARRAFALSELATVCAVGAALVAITVPAVTTTRSIDDASSSLDRLRKLGIAQAMYAYDFSGRQYTNTVDDITSYGSSLATAFSNYEFATGEPHPPVLLGDDGDGATWGYYMTHAGNYVIGVPFDFQQAFGWCRLPNARPLHAYVDDQSFYSHTYYTPGDTVAWEAVVDLLHDPAEYVPTGDSPYWASYAISPAALVNPEVMRRRDGSHGGWQNPFALDDGYAAPGLFQARYPELKTFIAEHHWNQDAPADRCNPCFTGGTYDGCEPYYFNHGWASAPATLFYDLSARLLPVAEAVAADAAVTDPFENGLWKRDTPLGASGYFSDCSYDDVDTSFHMLTTDGILGRDVIRLGPNRR